LSAFVCRKNSDVFETGTGQAIGKNFAIVNASNFNASNPTKIFLHGWLGAGWNWYIRDMRREILKKVSISLFFSTG